MENKKEIKSCPYCKRKTILIKHFQSYNPERIVLVCKSCQWKMIRQIRMGRGLNLCANCGRHFTSEKDKICYKCKHNQIDWFGLLPSDKTPPIIIQPNKQINQDLEKHGE